MVEASDLLTEAKLETIRVELRNMKDELRSFKRFCGTIALVIFTPLTAIIIQLYTTRGK